MLKIGLVVSEFNREITKKMEQTAENFAKENKVFIIKKIIVPGAYDMPLAVLKLAKKKQIQAIVCIGAIIKGETDHDKVIAQSLAKSLIDISIKYEKPVLLGVIGPNATQKKAKARAEEYAKRAILAAIKINKALKEI
jgi:6,7-dimethyl-8-ribityllumazine synthase